MNVNLGSPAEWLLPKRHQVVDQARNLGVQIPFAVRNQLWLPHSKTRDGEREWETGNIEKKNVQLFSIRNTFLLIMFDSEKYYLTVHFISWNRHGEVSGRPAKRSKIDSMPLKLLHWQIDRQTFTMTSDTGAIHAPLHLDSEVSRGDPLLDLVDVRQQEFTVSI